MRKASSVPQSHKSAFYHRLASLYEPFFARFFRDRAQSAIAAMEIPPGAKVLEIGVGTGLSLAAYPSHAQVIACDLSEDMLQHASQKIDEQGWKHIQLVQMDAQNLTFDDETFDYVMAFHVVTVVPDHRRLINEMVRVAKPNATILIVNHFRSHRRWLAKLIDLVDPVTRYLGWRTTLNLDDIIKDQPLKIEDRYKTASQSLFNVVVLRKASQVVNDLVPAPAIRRKRTKRPRQRQSTTPS